MWFSSVVLLSECVRQKESQSSAEAEFDRLLRQEREGRHSAEVRVDVLLDERHSLCVQHAQQVDLFREQLDCLQRQLKSMKAFVDVCSLLRAI